MTYNDWLLCVERTLRQSHAKLRISELDPDALKDAYDGGASPILFAKRDDLPMRHHSQKRVQVARSWAWLAVPLVLIPMAYAFRVIYEGKREKAGMARLANRNHWPVSLPLKTSEGLFMPAEASEAVAKVKEKVRESLLSPDQGEIKECDAVGVAHFGTYIVDGLVEGVNQYGTRTVARFRAHASRPYRLSKYPAPRPPEWKRKSDEWTVSLQETESQPESTVWRQSVAGQGLYGGYRQPSVPRQKMPGRPGR